MDDMAAWLRRAARRIETYGWAQWAAVTSDGRTCAYGALYYTADCGASLNEAIAAVIDALGLPAGSTLSQWNDAPERTKEDVVGGLELSAIWWEERQKERVTEECATTT